MAIKLLHLTLKKKWFDMIASGEKKEEYREIKPYWSRRLLSNYNSIGHSRFEPEFKDFNVIVFKNGYGKNAPVLFVEFKGVDIGEAVPEWSDNWAGDVFKIKLGNIIK
jgi:hypothetical protein